MTVVNSSPQEVVSTSESDDEDVEEGEEAQEVPTDRRKKQDIKRKIRIKEKELEENFNDFMLTIS
jgi:hypothetical protein